LKEKFEMGMMTRLLTAGAFAAAMTAGVAQAATVSFTATGSSGVPAGYGVNTGTATWLTEPAIVDGTAGGFRSPYDELGAPGTLGYSDYYTVGSPNLQGSPAVLSLAKALNVFSMLWGSVDRYNAVEFCFGTTCDRVTGSEIADAAPANFGTGNAIVDFTADFAFDRISFFSNEGTGGTDIAAFEFAIAPVPVPLPAGGLLLLGALGGIAALRRRKTA
jgi:hypothetical protein